MLGLNDALLAAVQKQGFDTPTEIQNKAIPHLMNGEDLMGVAQTGGGKTAAFALPILHRLLTDAEKTQSNKPRAVILAPTRELAQQIGQAIREFTRGMKIFHTVIYGGAPYKHQLQQLQRGVHIVVATPGRMLDHMDRGSIKLDNVHTFVLDEADRMLDMGFIHDVKKVADAMDQDRQTIMFSATMSKQVRNLANGLLNKPKQVEIARENTIASTIDHRMLHVKQKDKMNLLSHLLEDPALEKAIIFTRTKAMADRLCTSLQEKGRKVDTIHGDRQQVARQKVLKAFRNNNIELLVATDVAARGIDVTDISHVINYDMPEEGDAYVHRIGRTGRAGQSGIALSFCTSAERDQLRGIERVIRQRISIDDNHPFHHDVQITNTENTGQKKRPGGFRPHRKGPAGKKGGDKPAFRRKANGTVKKVKAKKVKKPNLKGRFAA